MTIPDEAQAADDNKVPTGCRPQSDRSENAKPGSEPTNGHVPVLYDKVDLRLMDTFPASDAVAQYCLLIRI